MQNKDVTIILFLFSSEFDQAMNKSNDLCHTK